MDFPGMQGFFDYDHSYPSICRDISARIRKQIGKTPPLDVL